jgi:two-component system, chemotaxis family, chemotaxis protein CheY
MSVDRTLPILLVDDQDTFLEIMKAMLRQLGFRNVVVAKDGPKAVATLTRAADPYGLVISDWNMQPMTGLQLLQTVRADPVLAATPFIMVTGEASKDRVVAALGAGVTGYIVKPISLDTLKKKLASLLGPL